MVLYRYRARTPEGESQEGTLEVTDLHAAMQELSEKGLRILSLAKVPPESAGWGRSVNDAELSQVSRKLASLTELGAPLAHSLTVITSEIRSPRLKNALDRIRRKLEAGRPLSDALAEFPEFFSPFHISMVRAGERSGTLSHMLYRLADIWQKQARLRARLRSILVYPICVLAAVLLFAFVFRLWLFPGIEKLYPEGAEIPAVTWFFLRCLDGIMVFLPALLAAYFLLKRLRRKRASFRLRLARMAFRLPVLGDLAREIAAARFSRSFGMLLRGGVETTEAMKLSAKVVGNPFVEREIEAAADYVSTGRSISEALAATNVMPRDLILAVSLSEDRGAVSQDLLEVADNHDAAVESKLDSLMQVIEPALLVFMGLFVTLCALSAWLPYIWMIPTVGPRGGLG